MLAGIIPITMMASEAGEEVICSQPWTCHRKLDDSISYSSSSSFLMVSLSVAASRLYPGLSKILRQGRCSGQLNLSSRELTAIPPQAFSPLGKANSCCSTLA